MSGKFLDASNGKRERWQLSSEMKKLNSEKAASAATPRLKMQPPVHVPPWPIWSPSHDRVPAPPPHLYAAYKVDPNPMAISFRKAPSLFPLEPRQNSSVVREKSGAIEMDGMLASMIHLSRLIDLGFPCGWFVLYTTIIWCKFVLKISGWMFFLGLFFSVFLVVEQCCLKLVAFSLIFSKKG